MIITDDKVPTSHDELPNHEHDTETTSTQTIVVNSQHDTEYDDWGPPPPYDHNTGAFPPSDHGERTAASIGTVTQAAENLTPVPSHKVDMESIKSIVSSAMTLALLFLPLILFMIEIRMLYGEISAGNNIPRALSGDILEPILLQPPLQVDRRVPYVNPHTTSSQPNAHSGPLSTGDGPHLTDGGAEGYFPYSDFGSEDEVKRFQRWRQRQLKYRSSSAHKDDPRGICRYSHHWFILSKDEDLYGSCSLDEQSSCHRAQYLGSNRNKCGRNTNRLWSGND
jgi:hypothetical protein